MAEETQAHTPGPWRVVDTRKVKINGSFFGGLSVVSDAKEPSQASEYYDYAYLICESLECEEAEEAEIPESIANAHLIAAAPDLLAALQSVVDTYFSYALVPKTSPLDNALTALRKAKGAN